MRGMIPRAPSRISQDWRSRSRVRGVALWLLAAVAACGCAREPVIDYKGQAQAPTVTLIHPPVRTIVRTVGQPSFIESYERTSIYPKLTGYIEKWIVDIGDMVKKGDVLATLFVPELVESLRTKKADVELDIGRIKLAKKAVEVALADVQAARSRVAQVQADLAGFQAEVDRWKTEVDRLTREAETGVVDRQILVESTDQFRSAAARRDEAAAVITTAQAELRSKEATAAKAKVAVTVADADLAVAQSEEKRLKAWVGYLTLTAPFDGVIVVRNANTFDFVLPATGDPTATPTAPDQSPGRAAPIYVVDRTDVVRVFVDIPEQDANFVRAGNRATVLARAFRDQPIPATVTRTSWALNVKSYTLRAEIDLPNTYGGLLPGMYSYAEVTIEHPNVHALPAEAFVYEGEKTFCWQYKDGKAVKTEIQTGVSDGAWTEVTKIELPPGLNTKGAWTEVDGTEQVILGDLSSLTDGEPVQVSTAPPTEKVAGANR